MGGYSPLFSPSDLNDLENKAKKNLKEGDQPQRRNVFISFANEDKNEVELLRGQAKNDNSNLEFIDRSLRKPFDSEDAEYIKRGIREKIRQASVTICYLSDKTAQSKWVKWEIEESLKLGKSVICVFKGSTPPSNLPSSVKDNKLKVVPWKQDIITKEIENAARKR